MELTLQPKKIPVYLHIPKNAGTYLISVFTRYFIRLFEGKSQTKIQRLTVYGDNFNLTLFVKFNSDYWKTDENIQEHDFGTARARKCGFPTLKTCIENNHLYVLAIVIESHDDLRQGFDIANQILNLCGAKGFYFSILRETFSRQQSLYNYITGEESIHEPSHKHIKEASFLEYLSSDSIEDSWLIRSITGMKNEESITNFWFNQCCNFLDNFIFLIKDIKNTDNIINEVLFSCFEEGLSSSDTNTTTRNSTKIENKITINDLDEQTKKKFLEHTYWDRKLWERYLNPRDFFDKI